MFIIQLDFALTNIYHNITFSGYFRHPTVFDYIILINLVLNPAAYFAPLTRGDKLCKRVKKQVPAFEILFLPCQDTCKGQVETLKERWLRPMFFLS